MGCDGKTPLPITAFSRVLPRQHLTKLLYLPTCVDFQKMRQRMQRQIEKRRTQREKGRPAFRVFARRAVAFAHTARDCQSSLPFPLAHIPFLSSLPPQRTEHYLFRALRWVIERVTSVEHTKPNFPNQLQLLWLLINFGLQTSSACLPSC